MAYEQFYGSYVSNAARCGVQVEVTENDTQFKLNDPYVYTYPNPGVGAYFATGTSSTKATLSATGQQTRTSTSTTGFTTIFVSGGLTWDKTHAAQTITVEAVYEYTDCYRSVDGVKFSGKSMATKSYTIPARTSYTVTLDSNGGTGAASTLEKWHGESLALPQPAKNGYEFSHWTDGTNNYTTTLPANVNEPITLTAVWDPIISAAYITQVYAARDDGSGTWDSQTGKHTSASDDGGYVYIRAWWRVEGADAATVSLGASMDSTPAWTGTAQQTSKPGTGELYIEGVAEWLTGDIADVAEQYDVTVTLSTGTGNPSDTRGTTVSTAFFTIDVLAGGHGIAFGKPATQQLFDVGMETNFDHDVRVLGTPLVPVGTILDFAAATAPSGYLVCDGSAVSRTTYSALFAVIGTTWGTGDGSTTFNIPDFRGRTSIGSGTGTAADATAHLLGDSYGAETHTLSGAQSGTSAHGHGFTQPTIQNHRHGISGNESYNLTSSASNGFAVGEFKIGTTGTTYSGFIRNAGTGNIIIRDSNNTQYTQPTATGGAVGQSTEAPASQPHNNMQPYATVTKIIRAL